VNRSTPSKVLRSTNESFIGRYTAVGLILGVLMLDLRFFFALSAVR
jgi:hypothetical protein